MPILPVLDLMAGQIVRGVAGQRSKYRPIKSRIVDSAEPVSVAEALRERFGFTEFYLADFDAIRGGPPAHDVYLALKRHGFSLWVDAGVQSAMSAGQAALPMLPCPRLIVGLESVLGPDALRQIRRSTPWDDIVFSLDMKNGKPVGYLAAWGTDDAWTIAQRVIELGIEKLIVLDIANVGMAAGTGTQELCQRLRQAYERIELTAGGGVRDICDVERLLSVGVNYVLVASALHDERITPEEVKRL